MKIGLRKFLPALIAGVWLGLPAGPQLAVSQPVPFVPATSVRDNIATTIENIRLLRGVPDGTVSCRGNRAGPRPTIRCDVRYVDNIAVTGIEITERENPANVWTASFRPYMQEEDETAYLLLVDRSNPLRAESIRRSAQDLAELFFQVAPKQHVAVAAFDTKLEVLQDFTSDGKAVAAALDKIRASRDDTTELYRLSLEAVQKLGQFDAPRKVLVIASNGKFDDTAYRHNQVAQEANRLNVRIVTIGYHEKQADVRDLQSLRRLSGDTRGFFFETPGAQRALTARNRNEFLARLHAGVIIEAEALARGIPPALQVSLRHPQGATTSFAVLLKPGIANPGSDNNPATPMTGDDFLSRALAWIAEDLTRTAAILSGIAILLFGILISGFAWRSSRRGAPEAAPAAPVRPAPTPRIIGAEPPTKAEPAAAPNIAAPAPPTVIRPPAPLAWLEFNGAPGTVPMYKPNIAIGRERDNDVVTDAQELTVSRHHALISVAPDGSFHIVNRSKDYRDDPNPLLVNGVVRESGKIADGDVIKLGTGNYGFLFRDAREGSHWRS